MSYPIARAARVRELADADDWSGIVRLSISLGVESEEIAEARECAERREFDNWEQREWLLLILEQFELNPNEPKLFEGIMASFLLPWNWQKEEAATLHFMRVFCVLAEGDRINQQALGNQQGAYEKAYSQGVSVQEWARDIGDEGMLAYGRARTATSCNALGRFHEAKQLGTKVRDAYLYLSGRFPGLYDRVLALALGNLGVAEQYLWDNLDAKASFEASIVRMEQVYADDIFEGHLDIAGAYINLANMHARFLECEEAVEVYQQALEILDQIPEPHNDEWNHRRADVLVNMGLPLEDMHKYEEANYHFEEALDYYGNLRESNEDYVRSDLARAFAFSGSIKWRLGKPRDGEKQIEKGVDVYSNLASHRFESYGYGYVLALTELGDIRLIMQDPDKAVVAHEKAWKLMQKLVHECPERYQGSQGFICLSWGEALQSQGDYEKSIHTLHFGLRAYGWWPGVRPNDSHPVCGRLINQIGLAYLELNELLKAQGAFIFSLRILKAHVKKHPTVYLPEKAEALRNLGIASVRRGRRRAGLKKIKQAIKYFSELSAIHPTAFLSEQLETFVAMARVTLDTWTNGNDKTMVRRVEWWQPMRRVGEAVGRFFDGSGSQLQSRQLKEATLWLRKARETGEAVRWFFDDHTKRQRFHGKMLHVYELLVSTLYRQWERKPQETTYLEEAFEAGEAARARTITELLAKQERVPSVCDKDIVEQFRRQRRKIYSRRADLQECKLLLKRGLVPLNENDPMSTLNAAEQGPTNSGAAGNGDQFSQKKNKEFLKARISRLQEWLEGDEEEYERLLAEIRKTDPSYDPDVPLKPATTAEVRNLLPANGVAVQFTVLEDCGYAIILTAESIDAVALPECSRVALRELSVEWNAKLADKTRNDKDLAEEIERIMDLLSGWVIKPIADRFPKGTKSVVLAPNIYLHQFPLHACYTSTERRLVEDYEVWYTPSFSVLAKCAERKRPEPESLLIVDVPSLKDPLDFREMGLAGIQQSFDSRSVERIDEAENARQRVFEQSVNAEVWHFTGHAKFEFEQPLDSVLQLGDGVHANLRLHDVYAKLELPRTKLAVLAGCQTGGLRPDVLDESVSFPLAFLFTGAQYVIYSLWPVNDLASA